MRILPAAGLAGALLHVPRRLPPRSPRRRRRRPSRRSRSRPSPRASCTRGAWRSCPTGGCWSPSGPGACASSARTASCRAPLQGVPEVYASGQGGLLDVRAGARLRDQPAHLFLLRRAARRRQQRHQRRARQARHRRATAAGSRTCRSSSGRSRPTPRATISARASSSAGRHRCSSPWATATRRATRRRTRPTTSASWCASCADGAPACRQPEAGRLARRRSGRSATATCRARRCNPATGKLWTVEHGARGGDEINIPQAGKNYGWPVITYGRDYSCAKIGEGTAKAGHGAAGLLLGPVDRAVGRGVLHRRPVPGMEGQPVRRRAGRAGAAPARARRRQGRRRGGAADGSAASASATCATGPTAPSGCSPTIPRAACCASCRRR